MSADTFNVYVPHLADFDIKAFDDFEVHPVQEVEKGVFEQCDEDEAAFFTVYAHMINGGLQALMDCIDRKTAESLEIMLYDLMRKADVNFI